MFWRWFIWCLALMFLGGNVVACADQVEKSQFEHKSDSEFPLTVDYSQPLEKMVAAGHYDWVDPDITDNRFPLQGSGTVNSTARLTYFNEWVTSGEVLRRLGEQGLRPAILPELLAFGVKYPDKMSYIYPQPPCAYL